MSSVDNAECALDALDVAWISRVLQQAGHSGVHVVEVIAEPMASAGAWCELRRLVLRYRGDCSPAPSSLVAKLPKNADARPVGEALGLFEREKMFYDRLADRVPITVPRCYHSGDGDAGREPLLLEDLTAWTAGDQVTGLDLAGARTLLTGAARMHAAFWASAELAAASWLLRLDAPAHVAIMGQLATAGGPLLAERMTGEVDEPMLSYGIAACQRIPEMLHAVSSGPSTLTHNDFRLDNVLYGPDGAAVLIDWQAAAWTRPTQDVAYLLTGSVPADVLSVHWEGLLHHYHDALTAAGVSDYSWPDIVKHYRQNVLYSFVPSLALMGSLSVEGERGHRLADALATRVFRHAYEIDALAALDCTDGSTQRKVVDNVRTDD